ncbi:MAG: adenylosuccinate lyase [Candidatus Magasanikbacteria bacterium RIFOXYD2_FULL_41_14]|uniref:Adenylosuccinate lyase n=1 Tax=Candidatus Magasanikbacteria bacterium RIFOXYD2_FULL_41_14 TaxID=1798709 RepID=A0A1F6PEQ7_9BACT|nr:MAG: adenylosuccinate lyase [Candidatus Magasanikbacteria bacterium RIFOXYD2_FULL_41_14]
MDDLNALSPLDGRYHNKVADLSKYFSESALIKYRVKIEIEYFIALSIELKIKQLPEFSLKTKKVLRQIYENFSLEDARCVKETEKTTNHDVKAVEYFIKEKIKKLKLKLNSEFVHFALTSEDINNLAFSLMWQEGLKMAYLPKLKQVVSILNNFSKKYRSTPLLALTHGQSATPTTLGKEIAVFVNRLYRQEKQLSSHKLLGKLNGATGTYSAQIISYPQVNWPNFSKKFVNGLGLDLNSLTTQVENHDSLAESYHNLERVNNILLDFTRDVWLYVMRGVLGQIKKEGEVGSSTMPHKINPINFENAEGNLGLANAYLTHLASKLPVSRLQRDLSDSTVLRNQGIPLGHSLLALENILNGLSRLTINENKINEELENNWEILAEAVQIIMRREGVDKPYEKLKELTRGQKIIKTDLHKFINKLDISKEAKKDLLKLTPQKYIGLANKLF